MPVDPKGFHYFLVVVEVAGKRVDAELLKDKTANRVLNGFVKIYRRNRIKQPTHRLETDSGSEFTNDQPRRHDEVQRARKAQTAIICRTSHPSHPGTSP
ncbi:hypothetical protein RhiirA4_487696 [Rhizophagus irregularis]|uniref:Integrase catalytic domain-containing protein n=1 Tax=Rhizophagus irregularis TaxID=588596 RepID=A0A2I1HSW8_9GLOM|nr:hypothetical protein RhiirA4_487696 [Rhizophagus irregularis]